MNDNSVHKIDDSNKDEIDLTEMIAVLFSNKFKIIIITTIFAVASVFYALSIPNQYKVTAKLVPAQKNNVSSLVGSLGSIASMAGVNLGESESNDTQIALEIMQSWSFIENFITSNNLAPKLSAVLSWDKATNQLIFNQDVYDVVENKWVIEGGQPSSWLLFRAFSGISKVTQDKLTGMISVSIEHYSPQIAKEWLDLYVLAINDHMKNRKLAKVSRSIEYLQEQINNTSISEMRDVFYTIIEEEIKNKMMAEATADYAFVSVSPSMIPEVKSRPKRASICVLYTLFGGMLSVIFVLLRHYTPQRWKKIIISTN
tara:strand:+ start:28 stop:969 length:942 start_codon:yes stop_codon:yes gene_type:complete